MAQSAYASGPISFTKSNGTEIFVSLEAIAIDDAGRVTYNGGADPGDAIKNWLQYLVSIGEIVARPAPPPPAFTVTASATGTDGNDLSAAVSYLPGGSQFVFTAKQRDAFGPVDKGNVATTVNAATKGLLRVGAVGSSFKPTKKQVLASPTGTFSDGTALSLATTKSGADAALVGIAIDTAGPSMTVSWTKTITVVPPTTLGGPASQRAQIEAAFAFLGITSTDDTQTGGVVVTPKPSTGTFDATTNKLDLPATSGTALTLTIVPPTSSDPTLFTTATKVTVAAASGGYSITVERKDTYAGANFTLANLATNLGTTGDATTPPTPGVVTNGMVLVRTTTPPNAVPGAFEALSPLALVPDGRYETSLTPSTGLSVTPTAALDSHATWAITLTPIDTTAGTFSLEAIYANSGTVDGTAAPAAQQTAMNTIAAGLATTSAPSSLPLGGTYALTGGNATTQATTSIPARS